MKKKPAARRLVETMRKKTTGIGADAGASKLARLVRREDYVRGDSGDLVHMDWSELWKGACTRKRDLECPD